MVELLDKLKEQVETVRCMVKTEWQKGNKNLSVCMEVNIDKAERILKDPDQKSVVRMIGIMNYYLERKEAANV